jgi:hypothetical protein
MNVLFETQLRVKSQEGTRDEAPGFAKGNVKRLRFAYSKAPEYMGWIMKQTFSSFG